MPCIAIKTKEPTSSEHSKLRFLPLCNPSPKLEASKKIKESIAPSTSKTVSIPVPTSSVACEKVLSKHGPSTKIPSFKMKSFGRVLTSAENVKLIEEKLQEKQKEEELKAE